MITYCNTGDINFSSPKAPHKVLKTLWGARYRQLSKKVCDFSGASITEEIL